MGSPGSRTRIRSGVLGLVFGTISGCSGPSSVEMSGEIDIESLPALVLEEELRIGSVEDPEYGFSTISSAAVDRDGEVYVFEAQDAQIRVYDSSGALVRRIGGPGQGPGEFTPGPLNPMNWGVWGDTVWALDRRARRITLFNREGGVLSTSRIADVLLGQESGYSHFLEPSAMDEMGNLVGGLPPEVCLPSHVGMQDSIPVPRVRFDGNGAVVDTLGWTIHRACQKLTTLTIGSAEVQLPFPLTTEPLTIELVDGHIEVVRTLADNADAGVFSVSRFRFDGSVRYSRSFRYLPVGYPETVLSPIVGRTARRSVGGLDSTSAHDAIRRALNVPEFQPPIQRVHLGDDGGVWLRREDDGQDALQWIVLDPDGHPRGQLRLPRAGFTLSWSHDNRLWAIERDELGIPWLVRYQLVEG